MLKLIKFPFGPLATNALLLLCEKTKKAAVIDPSEGSCDAILDRADGFLIEKILLTHSHWDHIADLATLKRKTKAPLYVHSLDAPNVKNPGSDGLPLLWEIEGTEPDGFLEDGQCVEVGSFVFEVVHTPGHSPGSICFYCKTENLLISGDTLFKGAMGRIDLPTGEPEKMWESLKKLAKLPSSTRVVPGHGMDTSIGNEKGGVLCH